MRKSTGSQLLLIIISLVIAMLMLAIDLFVRLENNYHGFQYMLPVLAGLYYFRRDYIYLIALACSLLAVAGFLFSSHGGRSWSVLADRGPVIIVIWLMALLVVRIWKNELYIFTLVDTIVDGIIITDANGMIKTFNKAAQRIFGYSDKEMIGNKIAGLMPAQYRDQHNTSMENYRVTGKKNIIGFSCEVEGLKKDGTVFPMELTVNEFPEGSNSGFVGVIHDISERKITEETIIVRSRQLAVLANLGEKLLGNMELQDLIDESAQAIINNLNVHRVQVLELLTNNKLLLIRTSMGTTSKLSGVSAFIVNEEPIFTYTLQTDEPVVVRDLNIDPRFMDNKTDGMMEMVGSISIIIGNVDNPFGILCVWAGRKHDFSDNDINFVQSVAGLLGIAIDRKKTETRMRDLQNELLSVSRMSVIGEFGTSLAHELNQPLTALMNYLQACRRIFSGNKPDDSSQTGILMDKAINEADRAAAIISHLRDYVATGVVYRTVENLNGVIHDASELALAESREKRIKVEYHLQNDLPAVAIDKIQIHQVVYNLLHNSVRALDQSVKSEILIKTVLANDNEVEVLIQDTGPGVAADILDQQHENVFPGRKRGMGVGLSICKSIIDAHDGRLWITDTPGGGASFHFTVPVSPATN